MVDIIDSKWSELDASNTGAAPDGVQGGYAPSTIAPILRSTRGALKRFYVQNNAIYTSTGSASAYVLTYAGAPAALSKGIQYAFWANHTNTGAATLNINALGAKAIRRWDNSVLAPNDIVSGCAYIAIYDGTAFRLTNSSVLDATKLIGTVPNASMVGDYTMRSLGVGSGNSTADGDVLINFSTDRGWTVRQRGDDASAALSFENTSGKQIYFSNETGQVGSIAINPASSGGSISINGSNVWHGGNMGPSSGLNADLLDGQHGSYYQNASNLNAGTLPNARISGAYDGITNFTMNGILRNDGTGEAIRINSTSDTSNPYMTFWKPTDGRQGYIQHDVSTGSDRGLLFNNDVAGTRLNLRNTGGVDGLGYKVGSSNYTVWHNGNLTAGDINGLYGYTPANGANSMTAGNGLSGGGTIGASRTITLGTPGTITNTTTNSVSTTSHTHALTLVSGDITGALGFTPPDRTNLITAGNGLSGGGALSADRTITLGTPGTITGSTGNTVSSTSHTHSISLSASDVGAVPLGRSVNAGSGLSGGGTLENAVTITMGTPGSITNSTTNSVTSSSHTHALGFVAAEVHTGGSISTTAFPLGHLVIIQGSYGNRNATATPRVPSSNDYSYDEGSGTLLSGTWRFRGTVSSNASMAQRVA